jgi:hypothetical protein
VFLNHVGIVTISFHVPSLIRINIRQHCVRLSSRKCAGQPKTCTECQIEIPMTVNIAHGLQLERIRVKPGSCQNPPSRFNRHLADAITISVQARIPVPG